jgi:hypothetical protein
MPAAPPAPQVPTTSVAAPAAEPPVWPAPHGPHPHAPHAHAPYPNAPVSAAPISAAPVSSVPVSGTPVSATPVSTSPLPQRIPAPPDVPELPEDGPDDQYAEPGGPLPTADLARTASRLRYEKDFLEQAPPPPEGFDFDAVLVAVRKVPGVRDAALKPNPAGVATLRLDLDEGADAAMVSRLVARLLKQKMGLAAEPRKPVAPPRLPPQPGGPPPEAAPGDDRTRRHPVTPVRSREDGEHRRPVRAGAAPRVVLDQVQVSTLGMDATVEVRLNGAGQPAIGVASGPAVDGYVLRLAAVAATSAIDQLLARVTGDTHGRSFVEHAAVVPFGSCEVAVVVVLLAYGVTVEQLTGSALVAGDPRQAVVRATLAAVNRRLDALLG